MTGKMFLKLLQQIQKRFFSLREGYAMSVDEVTQRVTLCVIFMLLNHEELLYDELKTLYKPLDF